MSHDRVTVRTLRPHDTTEGMKHPGDEYDRTKADADKLSARSIVEPVDAAKAKSGKRK
jgi:hypothetical protein